MSIVTSEGGLTALGYGLCAAVAAVCWIAASFITKSKADQQTPVKHLVFCGTAMALAFITSYIKLFGLPFGGSVTLFSMLFIVLIGNWYGAKTGLLTGFAYGILQFLQEPYVLSLFQVCCDYLLAFTCLGLSGVFSKSKNGLIKGYILGVLARGAFHALGGYLYWMDYMPDNFPKALTSIYPIVYNYSYLLAEGAITIAILMLPPVAKALGQIKKMALS